MKYEPIVHIWHIIIWANLKYVYGLKLIVGLLFSSYKQCKTLYTFNVAIKLKLTCKVNF